PCHEPLSDRFIASIPADRMGRPAGSPDRGPTQGRTSGSFTGTRVYRKDPTMQSLKNFVVDFVKREDGPTAVEYAVMLALIIVVCITAITTLGSNANKTFTSVGNAIGSTTSS